VWCLFVPRRFFFFRCVHPPHSRGTRKSRDREKKRPCQFVRCFFCFLNLVLLLFWEEFFSDWIEI
jgi:hypothetical protein